MVLQARELNFVPTLENIVKHRYFMGCQARPLVAWFQQMQNIILAFKDQSLRRGLLDFDVTSHRKIDNRRSDVAWIDTVIDKSAHLSWRHSLGRFIHRCNRDTG